jgi:hypothetical protein
MRCRGRPALGAIAGFFLGLFLGVDLLALGMVPLDSILLTVLPFLGLAVGLAVALWAPLGQRRAQRSR